MAAAKHKTYGLHLFKSGLLLFWGMWFVLVFSTNIFDFLSVYSQMPMEWRFRSGNLALIVSVVNIYHFSGALANLLFVLDIIIQGLAAVLFVIAAVKFWLGKQAWKWINAAFGISIALWALFILMDEFFIAYNFEGTHNGLFIAEILTLLAVHLLQSD